MAHPSSLIFSWYQEKGRNHTLTHFTRLPQSQHCLCGVCVCDVKEGGVKGVVMSTCQCTVVALCVCVHVVISLSSVL